ncbi:MAG: Crp/Fnr family transcriptional regulator [Rhizobiaceae bacterium]|nr:Crp/Fnr family transcriptional regulator [Rhizobiaceae bacterium]
MSSQKRQDIHNSEIPLVCLSCEARHGGICGALEPSQLLELSKHTTRTAHERDKDLSVSQSDPDVFSNILGGVVKLMKIMPDGRQQIVGLQFAPDFLGRPFSDSSDLIAEAATDIRLCSFPKRVIEKILKETPEMEHRLHEQHMRELDEARDWMLTLGRKTAIEKVASFILMLVSHIDPEKGSEIADIEISLPLKRADIADYLGLTIETVSRQVTNLRKKGVIAINDRKSIIVVNKDRLETIANQGD